MDGIKNIVHWTGSGWYAPIMIGEEVHEYRVGGLDDSYDEASQEARRNNLGTPGYLTPALIANGVEVIEELASQQPDGGADVQAAGEDEAIEAIRLDLRHDYKDTIEKNGIDRAKEDVGTLLTMVKQQAAEIERLQARVDELLASANEAQAARLAAVAEAAAMRYRIGDMAQWRPAEDGNHRLMLREAIVRAREAVDTNAGADLLAQLEQAESERDAANRAAEINYDLWQKALHIIERLDNKDK